MLAVVLLSLIVSDVTYGQKKIEPLFRPDSIKSFNSGSSPNKLRTVIEPYPSHVNLGVGGRGIHKGDIGGDFIPDHGHDGIDAHGGMGFLGNQILLTLKIVLLTLRLLLVIRILLIIVS